MRDHRLLLPLCVIDQKYNLAGNDQKHELALEHQQLERVPLPVKRAREQGHVADEGGDQPKRQRTRARRGVAGFSTASAIVSQRRPILGILSGTAFLRLRA